jgi:predicted nuclease of predicted toxin-antitoxin system
VSGNFFEKRGTTSSGQANGRRTRETRRSSLAHDESRVLVTLDKDFGKLAIVRGREHSGIVRLVALSTTQQAEMCVAVLAKYGPELEAGAIVTVEAGRVRVRSASERE